MKEKTNNEIVAELRSLVIREREAISEVVLYLSELDRRGYYRDLGYSSLFSFCTEGLRYSEGAAQRRIQAARSLSANPEIYELLKSGKLTLTTVCEVVKVITPENKAQVFEASSGKSLSQVQKVTVEYMALLPAKPKETIRAKKVLIKSSPDLFTQASAPQSETRYSVALEADAEFMKLYEEAKAFIGHRPMVEVLKKTLTEFVARRNQVKQIRQANSNSRYISKSVRVEVQKRDGCQCSYITQDGHRCSATVGLQYDHIKPFGLGGESIPSNLRLLCRAHNQLLSEKTFGRSYRRCESDSIKNFMKV